MENQTNYKKYPIFLNIADKKILIIGAGYACLEKLLGLEKTGAKIQIISLDIREEVQEYLNSRPEIICELRAPVEADFANRDIIFLATSDSTTNKTWRQKIKNLGYSTWVNSVDDPKNCDFFSSSSVQLGPVQFSISTDGKFAGVSSTLRKLWEEMIPKEDADLWESLFQIRSRLKQQLPTPAERRIAFQKLLKELEKEYFGMGK